MQTRMAAVGVLGAVVLSVSSAHADPQAFGAKGQVILSSTGGANVFSTGRGLTSLTPFVAVGVDTIAYPPETTAGVTTQYFRKEAGVALNPALDVFARARFSVGGEIVVGYASLKQDKTTTTAGIATTTTEESSQTFFGIMPRFGYDFVLSESFSIWLRLGAGFLRISGNDRTTNRSFFFADIPLLWHPSTSFFVGLGPGISVPLLNTVAYEDRSTDTSKRFTFRILSFTIGGVL